MIAMMQRDGNARIAQADGALQEGRQESEAQGGDGAGAQAHRQRACKAQHSVVHLRAGDLTVCLPGRRGQRGMPIAPGPAQHR